MAVTLLNATTNSTAITSFTGHAATFVRTVSAGSNRLLEVTVQWTGAATISTVAYGGQAMTSAGAASVNTGQTVQKFTLLAAGIAAATTTNIVVTWSADPTAARISARVWAGASGVGSYTVTTGSSGGTTTITPASVSTGDYSSAAIICTINVTATSGLSQYNVACGTSRVADSILANTSPNNLTWTFGGAGVWAAAGIRIIAAASLPATTVSTTATVSAAGLTTRITARGSAAAVATATGFLSIRLLAVAVGSAFASGSLDSVIDMAASVLAIGHGSGSINTSIALLAGGNAANVIVTATGDIVPLQASVTARAVAVFESVKLEASVNAIVTAVADSVILAAAESATALVSADLSTGIRIAAQANVTAMSRLGPMAVGSATAIALATLTTSTYFSGAIQAAAQAVLENFSFASQLSDVANIGGVCTVSATLTSGVSMAASVIAEGVLKVGPSLHADALGTGTWTASLTTAPLATIRASAMTTATFAASLASQVTLYGAISGRAIATGYTTIPTSTGMFVHVFGSIFDQSGIAVTTGNLILQPVTFTAFGLRLIGRRPIVYPKPATRNNSLNLAPSHYIVEYDPTPADVSEQRRIKVQYWKAEWFVPDVGSIDVKYLIFPFPVAVGPVLNDTRMAAAVAVQGTAAGIITIGGSRLAATTAVSANVVRASLVIGARFAAIASVTATVNAQFVPAAHLGALVTATATRTLASMITSIRFVSAVSVSATTSALLFPVGGAVLISSTSGTLSHGSSVTINGTNYGSKSASTPFKWDTMNGSNGAALEPRGWLVETNTPMPVLTTAVVRSTPSRTTSAVVGQTGADVPGFAFGDNGGSYLGLTSASAANIRTPPTSILVDYWMYFVNAADANNYKFWRWHTNDHPGTVNAYWSMPNGSTGAESSTMGYFSTIGVSTIENNWQHHRIYFHPSATQNQYYFQWSIDGHLWMDSDSSGNYVAVEGGLTEGPWPVIPGGDRLSTWLWEMQDDTAGTGSRDAKMYLCDIAVDEGYGAVYIGNASTWAACTHTEYQPYTSWGSSAIAITLNRGTFSTGGAYLYVVNNNRVANINGFAITLT